MKRSTRDSIRIFQNWFLKVLGVSVAIGIVAIYWANRNTEIDIIRKGLVCQNGQCHLEIVLQNAAKKQLSGKVFVQYIKKERASSNMGPNDGFVHRVFAESNLTFSLKPNQRKTLIEPYSYGARSPMVTATVVIDR